MRFPPPGDTTMLERGAALTPRFGADGLIAAVTTDAVTGEVLMLAWMNAEALEATLETGEAHYWSRSRGELWHKGATSGQVQHVVEARIDCDQDAVWLKVKVGGDGGACHVGFRSCFYRVIEDGLLVERSSVSSSASTRHRSDENAGAAAPVLVIAGSTRSTRRSLKIAEWIARLGREGGLLAFEVVDLQGLDLGLDDEPAMAASGRYIQSSTRAWSRRVASACGLIFVTPQYNWGYPAALKNAIDHLYAEWRGKPSLIVTYGGHGGGKCAAQLRQVLIGVKANPIEPMPALRLSSEQITADDGKIDPVVDFSAQAAEVATAIGELGAVIAATSAEASAAETPSASK